MMRPLLVAGLLAGASPAFGQPVPCVPPATPPAAAPGEGASSAEESPGFWDRDTMFGDPGGVRARLQNAGVRLGLQEQLELWGNLSGGITTGAAYNGLTTACMALDLDRLVGWPDATFFVNAFQIHGKGPDPLVGALQTPTDLEARDTTRLFDLWLEQTLLGGTLSLRVGQEGADDEFFINDDAQVLINASVGFPGMTALDLPSGGPSYPLSTPFVRLKYTPNDTWTVQAGVFNGDPAGRGTGDPQVRDASGTAFRLDDGAFAIAEMWYSVNQNEDAQGPPGRYKLGAWFHSGRFRDQYFDNTFTPLASPLSDGVPLQREHDYGVFASADQMVFKTGKDAGLYAYGRVMGGPNDRNLVSLSVVGGLNWKGVLPARAEDTVNVGFSYIRIGDSARRFASLTASFGEGPAAAGSETSLEASYVAQVTPWLALQPDAQYVINPGAGFTAVNGVRTKLRNATLVGVRGTVTF